MFFLISSSDNKHTNNVPTNKNENNIRLSESVNAESRAALENIQEFRNIKPRIQEIRKIPSKNNVLHIQFNSSFPLKRKEVGLEWSSCDTGHRPITLLTYIRLHGLVSIKIYTVCRLNIA